MSDGITDGYREERRSRDYATYLLAIATHLINKTQDTSEAATGDTYSIQKLIDRDLQEWARYVLDCKENSYTAYERARLIAPWSRTLSIHKVEFSTFNEVGQFFEFFFRKEGYATNRACGNRPGYDSYAIIIDSTMTLHQIVKTSIWLGFHTTGWTPGVPTTPEPTTPWIKDRPTK